MNDKMKKEDSEKMADSTLFVFEGSEDDFYQLMSLFEKEKLSELLGVTVLDLGRITESQLVTQPTVNLSQWFQNNFSEAIQAGWQTFPEIFGRTPRLAFRSTPIRQVQIQQAKQIQLENYHLVLTLELAKTPEQRISIFLGVYPLGEQSNLPKNLKLVVFVDAKENLEIPVNNDLEGFSQEVFFSPGEQFSIQVISGDESVTENFTI